jgi:hypothetical protein
MKKALMLATLTAVAGCSFVPDVEYSYYPAKSTSSINISQAVTCNSDSTALVVVNVPTVNISYAADRDQTPVPFKINDLNGAFAPFADTDVSFSFYDDGRLKGINQSTTGQGEAAIKSAVSLATTLAAVGAGAPSTAPVKKPKLPICTTLASFGGGKAVTLVYTAEIDASKATDGPIQLTVSPDSQALADLLKGAPGMPLLVYTISDPVPTGSGVHPGSSASSNTVKLTLQQTASVNVEIHANYDDNAHSNQIWTGVLVLPTVGTYDLPIPRAALFGKQSFSLSLAESGAVTSVDYGKNTGASGILNAGAAIAATQAPEAASAQAADIKAQADIIYQTKRLAACRASSTACTGN